MKKDRKKEKQVVDERFSLNDRGIGVVEVILILVILIGLVLLFKNEITAIVTNAFDSIHQDSGSILL